MWYTFNILAWSCKFLFVSYITRTISFLVILAYLFVIIFIETKLVIPCPGPKIPRDFYSARTYFLAYIPSRWWDAWISSRTKQDLRRSHFCPAGALSWWVCFSCLKCLLCSPHIQLCSFHLGDFFCLCHLDVLSIK